MRPFRFAGTLLIVACFCGCRKQAPAPERRAPEAANRDLAAKPSSGASTVPPAPSVAVNEVPSVSLEDLVQRWNAAHNAHDAAALAALYAPRVRFFTQELPRAKVVESKREAFARAPRFQQELSALRVELEGNRMVAHFLKRSGEPGKLRAVRAQLGFEPGEPGTMLVAEETDEASVEILERRAQQNGVTSGADGGDESCEGAANEIAFALPVVKKLFDAAGPDSRMGGISYPAEGGDVSSSIGFHHDDHFEPAFFVDVVKGVLSVRTAGGDELPLPPGAAERVRKACAVPH